MNENTNEIEYNPDLIDESKTEVATPVAHAVKRPRGRPAKVEKQIFIDAWNNSTNLNEVASMLGMPTTSASVKASQLRKSGCELKMFRRGRRKKTAI
tara:strand:- start:151 stop:441 length:291 start_codon:yes stop_codon:yes gene_type:complete